MASLLAFVLAYAMSHVHGTSTSVRVAIPDLAGTLYPAQTNVLQRFATSTSPTLYATETLADGATLPQCGSSIVLCLDIVWTSAYENDVFTLLSVASKGPVVSPTFDPLTASASNLLPFIQGNASRDSQSTRISSALTPKTLWRFHAVASSTSDAAAIDILFRLRQRSQTQAARDQLLVHVVGTRTDSFTKSASIEAFAVYGNQRVRHRTSHIGTNQLRVDIDIGRNASASDVLLADAYPLVPLSSTIGSNGDCDSCTQELEACRTDDQCRLVVLPCVERIFSLLSKENAEFDAVFGTYRVDYLSSVAACFDKAPVPSWNPIRRAFVCISSFQCAIDGAEGDNQEYSTMLRLQPGSQVIIVPVEADGRIALEVSGPHSTFQFHQTPEELAAFLQVFALQSSATVNVTIAQYAPDPPLLQLSIQYQHAFTQNPSISNSAGALLVHENTQPRGYIEVPDLALFSVAKAAQVLRLFMRSIANVPASATAHPWALAPECRTCHALLYGCSPSDVAARTCLYDNATSPLAECVRSHFPRSTLAALVQGTNESTSLSITSRLADCLQQVVATSGDTLDVRTHAAASLNCYAATRCPFGPVDLVSESRMLRLTVSSIAQQLRVEGSNFSIPIVFKRGDHVAATAVLDRQNLYHTLSKAMAQMPYGNHSMALRSNDDNTEWTWSMAYDNHVMPGFTVSIGPNSMPPRPLLQHSVLYPQAKLYAAPRDSSKVYYSRNESTGSSSSSSSTSSSGSAAGSLDSSSNSSSSAAGSQVGGGSAGSAGSGGTDAGSVELTEYLDYACHQCDEIHLAACNRSALCRSGVAGCFQQALRQHSFAGLAEEFSIGETSMFGANLQPLLHTCAQDASMESRFDWWDGLQRWLGCYAAHQCATSSSSTTKSFLVFKPATIVVETSMADPFSQGFVPLVQGQRGSGLRYRETRAADRQHFNELLSYMVQDISNVSVAHTTTSQGYGRMTIEFDAPFLGDPPSVLYESWGILYTEATDAKLYVVTEPDALEDGAWDRLLDRLDRLVWSPLPVSDCQQCASEYLTACQHSPLCKNYVLECIQSSVDSHYGVSFLEDRSLHRVIVGCTRNMTVNDWAPVRQYLTCWKNLQCPASTPGQVGNDANSYLRFVSGGVRFPFSWTAMPFSITLQFPGETAVSSIGGTLQEIHTQLTSMVGNVELRTHRVSGASFVPMPVELVFHDYIGVLPTISLYGEALESWSPRVILYGSSSVSPYAVLALLSQYVPTTPCNIACAAYLEDCASGESATALLCNRKLLPCVQGVLNNEVLSMTTMFGDYEATSSPNFVDRLLQCVAQQQQATGTPNWLALTPITKYLQCFVDHRCSVNAPSSIVPRTHLEIVSGVQTLKSSTEIDATLISPIDYSSVVALSSQVDPATTQWRIRSALSKAATVNVSIASTQESGIELSITYTGFMGPLPDISAATPLEITTIAPSIKMVSTNALTASSWTRLLAPIEQRTATDSSLCNACVNLHLPQCSACRSVFVPSLLMALSESTDAAQFRDITAVFYNAFGTIAPYEWLPVARLLQCLAKSACQLGPSSYLVITPATMAIEFSNPTLSSLVLISGVSPLDTTTQEVRTTQYISDTASLLVFISSLLDYSSGPPSLSISDREQEPSVTSHTVDVTIRDYFGWVPKVYGSGEHTGVSTLPTFQLHSVDASAVSSDGLAALVAGHVTTSYASWRATDLCLQCSQTLLGCSAQDVENGFCTYTTSSSFAASCLRKHVPPSVFYGLARQSHGATYSLTTAMNECFASAMASDQGANHASFRDDLWYAMNEQLACFESVGCAFGPLSESVFDATSSMVQLHAALGTKQFSVYATSFELAFQASFGFRVLVSEPFTQSTDSTELETLLHSVMPESEATVAMEPMGSDQGVVLTITYKFIYFPGFHLAIVAVSGSPYITDDWPDRFVSPELKTSPLDATYMVRP